MTDAADTTNVTIENLKRECRKAANVLRLAERYFTAYNESMAALHMSPDVMPSPLTAAISQAAWDCENAAGVRHPVTYVEEL